MSFQVLLSGLSHPRSWSLSPQLKGFPPKNSKDPVVLTQGGKGWREAVWGRSRPVYFGHGKVQMPAGPHVEVLAGTCQQLTGWPRQWL